MTDVKYLGPRYVAIDIETTGLDLARAQILQVGAVFDDGESPTESLKRFDAVVRYDSISYGEPFALQLNAGLFRRMSTDEAEPLANVRARFLAWLHGCPNGGSMSKLTPAGKNFAGFDRIILEREFGRLPLSHRTIDPGALWLPDFGYVPSQGELNERLGRPKVSHDAVADCLDVVAAIRAKTWDPLILGQVA